MSWDSNWNNIYDQNEWGKYPAESLIRFIARNFYKKDRGNIRILEVGCGPGANIWYMAREGFDAYGIDGSDVAIKKAQQRLGSEGLNADLRTGDVIKLPYEDEFFDAVLDVECLYANPWEDTVKIISEIKRVLKKEGLFYSRTIADDTYKGKSYKNMGNWGYDNISDGPLKGKGFVRLTDRASINKLYCAFPKILSVDKLYATSENEAITTSEWIIICANN